MKGDLRGFAYPLQPVLNRQHWRIDRLRARLGAAQRAVQDAEEALQARERELLQQHAELARTTALRLDPAMVRRNLHWLAAQREDIARGAKALDALKEKRAELVAELNREQAKLEALNQHRSDDLAGYLQVQHHRAAAAADSEWIARRPGAGTGEPQ